MKNRKATKTAILALALVQMGTNGIAPALSGIAASFPDIPASVIQYLMTFPSLMVVIVSLFAAGLSRKIPKKHIAITGCALCAIGGVLAAVIHTVFPLLFIWAGIIGIGIGLIVPMIYSLVTDLFEGEERAAMMGNGTSSSNLGAMFMTLIGGFLASAAWSLNYLVYLITIPALVLSLLFLPNMQPTDPETGSASPHQSSGKLGPHVIVSAIFAGVFLFLFNVGPTNLSMLVTEYGLGSAAAAGNASTVFLLGGTVMGILFGKAFKILKEYILSAGALAMVIGFLIISHASNIGILCIGCFIAGTSISFAMPKCMFTASADCTPAQATMAVSIVMAIGNLGTFGTPILTSIAEKISHSASVGPRFTLAIIIALMITVITFIQACINTKKANLV